MANFETKKWYVKVCDKENMIMNVYILDWRLVRDADLNIQCFECGPVFEKG